MKVSQQYHITKNGKYKRNPSKKPSEYLTISKVPYDYEAIGEPNKDYWCNGGKAMNITEWRDFAIKKHYLGLRIFDRDGSVRLEII